MLGRKYNHQQRLKPLQVLSELYYKNVIKHHDIEAGLNFHPVFRIFKY